MVVGKNRSRPSGDIERLKHMKCKEKSTEKYQIGSTSTKYRETSIYINLIILIQLRVDW